MEQDIKQVAVFNAPIQKVWEKVTTSESIASWFMPNDFELKEGHEFHLQSPFGPSSCKVLKIDAPNELVFSWDTEGWVVSFLLKELESDQTEFTLIHSGWKNAEDLIGKANEKTSIIRDRMAGGWISIVNERLRNTVES
ncbi:SRPBCC family protein [Metabacillus sp. RGM 3146]|uniref:SRPBCC family protein n=1 Tax=Metabacillus sp. RGM 3146 TaxID=3401092 RepID=UPI003B9CFCC6